MLEKIQIIKDEKNHLSVITFTSLHFRSTKHSYEIGVLTDATYEYSKKRSIISLKMCIMTMIYEFISNIFVLIAPVLKFQYGLPNTYFIDPISMFVIIPFLQLMNDEDTKEIIFDENWFQAIKYILGLYNPSSEESNGKFPNNRTRRNERSSQNDDKTGNSPSNVSQRGGPEDKRFPSFQKNGLELKSYLSLPNITSDVIEKTTNVKTLKRSNSCFGKFSTAIETQPCIQEKANPSDLQKLFSRHFIQKTNYDFSS